MFFVIINYTIYIYQLLNNGDLKEVSWNHTIKRFNCSPCRPSNCSCDVSIVQHWNKAKLSHECLYVLHQQQKQRASIVYFTTFNSCKWGLFHVVPNTWILHKSVYQKYGWSGQCLTPFPIAWVDREYTEMKSPNIHIDLHIYVTAVSTYCGLFIQLPWCHLPEILFLKKVT